MQPPLAYVGPERGANYHDYSGYINLDQNVTAMQLGASFSYRILYLNYFEIKAFGDASLSYIKDEVDRYIITNYYYAVANRIKLRTVSPTLEAGMELMYNFTRMSFGVEGGYQVNFLSKLKMKSDESYENEALYPDGDLNADISGIRVGVKFILWFTNDLL